VIANLGARTQDPTARVPLVPGTPWISLLAARARTSPAAHVGLVPAMPASSPISALDYALTLSSLNPTLPCLAFATMEGRTRGRGARGWTRWVRVCASDIGNTCTCCIYILYVYNTPLYRMHACQPTRLVALTDRTNTTQAH
jgi:hypothetical protein